ncbi:MAG: hypothetical protein ACRDTH_11760 [Pseudonocardiaceae bacterium]
MTTRLEAIRPTSNHVDGHVSTMPFERSGTDRVHDPVDDVEQRADLDRFI